MKNWLAGRSPRERQILIAGAVIAVPLLLWLALWQPLLKARAAADDRLEQRRETLVWMQEAARQVNALKARQRPATSGMPEQRITGEAARYGVTISRIEPVADNRFNLWLTEADYQALVRLLDGLQKQGFAIQALTLSQLAEPGRITARMTVGTSA